MTLKGLLDLHGLSIPHLEAQTKMGGWFGGDIEGSRDAKEAYIDIFSLASTEYVLRVSGKRENRGFLLTQGVREERVSGLDSKLIHSE